MTVRCGASLQNKQNVRCLHSKFLNSNEKSKNKVSDWKAHHDVQHAETGQKSGTSVEPSVGVNEENCAKHKRTIGKNDIIDLSV